MTYDEFKQNFLPDFNNIKSFAGKVKYADERLQRIGSGSGRVVYDIDGEKALKLAKNPKGVAQNEAESNIGRYRDTHHIVTEIFDNADDESWLIAEKAKKVNEKRIKELTGIPSLYEFYKYLRNTNDQNNGKGIWSRQAPEIEEFFYENDFANDMTDFIANYAQQPGDYNRPSSYGEVLRDGQPSIVLTDYGLNDEVYSTHYDPYRNKKQGYRMYEMYNFADGNDDILSDIGNTGDVRKGMWALIPQGIGDGDGEINENFINFIENRSKYPNKPVSSIPYILDEFHDVVNNLNEVLKRVKNKKKFYNNLLELQNYLIRGNFYDREPLEIETLNEDSDISNIPNVEFNSLDKSYSDSIVDNVAEKLNLGKPNYLGEGSNGQAYLVSNNKVLKLTSDVSEIVSGGKIINAKPKSLVPVYKVYKIYDTENNIALFGLLMEYVADKPVADFVRYQRIVNDIGDGLGLNFIDIVKVMKKRGNTIQDNEAIRDRMSFILTEKPEANISQNDRQQAYNYMMGLLNINNDLIELEIKSSDYTNPQNTGYLNGVLTYFDIGGDMRAIEPPINKNNYVILPENDSSLIFEELERLLHERIKSSMPGSSAVEVKKKCRLGGNGSTSTACNQGDISNLNFKSINEEIDASEAYDDDYIIPLMVAGKKDVSILPLGQKPNLLKLVDENGLGKISVNQSHHNVGMHIVYTQTPRGKINADKLNKIMISHGGYVADKTPKEAYEIGKLLDYSDESIMKFINRVYIKNPDGSATKRDLQQLRQYDYEQERRNKIPVMPEKTHADYNDLDENVNPGWFSGSQVVDDAGNPLIVYHGTNKDFTRFNLKNAAQPIIWFSSDRDKIERGDAGAAGRSRIIKAYLSIKKMAGWNEYSKYGLGQLRDMGYDGAKLDDDYFVFSPKQIKIIKDKKSINEDNEIGKISAIWLEQMWNRLPVKHRNNALHQKWYKKALNGGITKKEWLHLQFLLKNGDTMYNRGMLSSNNESIDVMNETELISLQDLPFKQEVEQLGGKIFSVGGAVRDEFLGKESKDLDILITGIPMEGLEQILSKYGRVDAVGKSFGVLKFKPRGATEDIDIAIPRTEKPTGTGGHQGFDVTSDHALPIEKDLERRDFTINAIAKDINGNIVDPYHGQEDLKNKIIRIVNPEAFSDDPLRMLRAVQFASRFGFTIEPQTMQMIIDNASRIREIPAERILTEFDKIVKKGDKRVGAQLLKDTGLFKNIFGYDIKQSSIDRYEFDDVKTMGEFLYLLNMFTPNFAEYYKNNLKGEIDTAKEIKALDMAFNSGEATNLVEARSIAHNMFVTSPQSLQSQIIPSVIKTAANELLQGKYPKTLSELAVNGNDLMALGLQGKEVGDALKMMLLKVYSNSVNNNKDELLTLLQ